MMPFFLLYDNINFYAKNPIASKVETACGRNHSRIFTILLATLVKFAYKQSPINDGIVTASDCDHHSWKVLFQYHESLYFLIDIIT